MGRLQDENVTLSQVQDKSLWKRQKEWPRAVSRQSEGLVEAQSSQISHANK